MCRNHTLKQPAASSGSIQISQDRIKMTKPNIPLNTVVVTASSR